MSGMPLETPKVKVEHALILDRPQTLRHLADSIDIKASLPQDRVSCIEEQLFLRSVLRTPERPLVEVIAILIRKMEAPKISSVRRQQMADHIGQLRMLVSSRLVVPSLPVGPRLGSVEDSPSQVLPLGPVDDLLTVRPTMPKAVWDGLDSLPEEPFVDPHAYDDDESSPTQPSHPTNKQLSPVGIAMPTVTSFVEEPVSPTSSVGINEEDSLPAKGPATITPVFGQAGDAMMTAELPVLSSEQLAHRDSLVAKEKAESQRREILVLKRGFEEARVAAERWVLRVERGETLEEMLELTVDGVAEAHIELETIYGISVESIRGKVTDSLTAAYFEALERAGDDSLGFRSAFRSYIGLRARLGALLRVESRLASLSAEEAPGETIDEKMTLTEAREALGVFDDAGRDDVEKAYALRLQSLDLHDGADALVMKRLMRGREVLLENIERSETQAQESREAADRLQPSEVADVPNVPPQHRADRWYVEAMRKPGRAIRNLFFGGAVALGAGAGVAAVHEFVEAANDQPADDYSLRVISGPFDGTAGALSALVPKPRVPMKFETVQDEIRLVPHGSAIWNEAGKMLRERGLKSTPALTSYFSHLLEVTNARAIDAVGGVHHLPDNFPLVVTAVAAEMDAKAGIKKAEALKESPKDSFNPEQGATYPSTLLGYGFGGDSDWSSPIESFDGSSVSHGNNSEIGTKQGTSRVFESSHAIPTVDHPMRVMLKGEYLGKVTHSMLRANGLNWTTARINQLNDLVWQQNLPLFERLVIEGKMRKLRPEYIPMGIELNFSSAAQEVQRLAAAKKSVKKGR